MKDLIYKLILDGIRKLGLNEEDKRLWEYIKKYLEGDFSKENFSIVEGARLEYDYSLAKFSGSDKTISGKRVLRWKHGYHESREGMTFEYIYPDYSVLQRFYRGNHPITNAPINGFSSTTTSSKKVRDSRIRVLSTTTTILTDKGIPIKLDTDISLDSLDSNNESISPIELSGGILNKGDRGIDPRFELSNGRPLFCDGEGILDAKVVNLANDKDMREDIAYQDEILSQGPMFRKTIGCGKYMNRKLQLLLEYFGSTLSDDMSITVQDRDSSVYYRK